MRDLIECLTESFDYTIKSKHTFSNNNDDDMNNVVFENLAYQISIDAQLVERSGDISQKAYNTMHNINVIGRNYNSENYNAKSASSEGIKEFFKKVWEGIKAFFKKIIKFFQMLWFKISGREAKLKRALNELSKGAAEFERELKEAISNIDKEMEANTDEAERQERAKKRQEFEDGLINIFKDIENTNKQTVVVASKIKKANDSKVVAAEYVEVTEVTEDLGKALIRLFEQNKRNVDPEDPTWKSVLADYNEKKKAVEEAIKKNNEAASSGAPLEDFQKHFDELADLQDERSAITDELGKKLKDLGIPDYTVTKILMSLMGIERDEKAAKNKAERAERRANRGSGESYKGFSTEAVAEQSIRKSLNKEDIKKLYIDIQDLEKNAERNDPGMVKILTAAFQENVKAINVIAKIGAEYLSNDNKLMKAIGA